MPRPIKLCEIAATVRAKRERRKEARPGELLAAALELFVDKGYAATRVEEVAQRAGVSKGTLFLYFSTKEELFKAVVRENISGKFGEWASELASWEGSSADLLRACMTRWWERIGSTKASGIHKLLMSEARNFPELAAFFQTEVMQPGDELLRRVLQRGMQRGEFRPIDVHYGVHSMLAPMLFLSVWKNSMGKFSGAQDELDPEKFIAAQIDTILHGICTPPAIPSHQSPPSP
jgi:TetR/AcrR family transcriptional regulator